MSHFIGTTTDRPNRVSTKENEKTEEYHLQYGKFALGSSTLNHGHSDFIYKTKINKDFYKGGDGQWSIAEDLEQFLRDDSGQHKNRIKVVQNFIRPLVEQFRGNASRLQINYKARSRSKQSIDRRERKLAEQMLFFDLSEEYPGLADNIREISAIGGDANETVSKFNNLYVDELAESINEMIGHNKGINDLQAKQIRVAQNFALSGLIVMEGFEHGGEFWEEIVESESFFFDPEARKENLTDSDFMGKIDSMIPTDVYERWDASNDDKIAIENYLKHSNNLSHDHHYRSRHHNGHFHGGNKVPVYHVYWRDTNVYDLGWVESEFGTPRLVKVNFTRPDEEEPEFTDADLIDPPKNARNKKRFKGGKKAKVSLDVLRYAIFIPSEILATGKPNSDGQKVDDILLDWGVYDYQEVDQSNLTNVKFPFKAQTWAYVDGEILSPVDDAISPQRFVNRILSVAESQINNSGGAGMVYDSTSISDDFDEAEILRATKQGNPVKLNSKGKGIPNTIGNYDHTPQQGTYALFNLIPIMQGIIQESTGVNEALKGESIGQDQLVGVTQLLIQKGSLMQEPFYDGIAKLFKQVYQMIAKTGKEVYIDNQTELIIAVGETNAKIITLSEDLRLEDFDIFIERENVDEVLKANADQLLMQFLQLGMINQAQFSNLFGRSTPNQVAEALRVGAATNAELKRLQAQQAQQQQAQAGEELAEQQRQENLESQVQQSREDEIRAGDQNHEIEKIFAKQAADAQQAPPI